MQASRRGELDTALASFEKSWDYVGYVVLDRQALILASNTDNLIGKTQAFPGYATFLEQVLAGKALVSQPFRSITLLPDEWGGVSAGVPTMFTSAPVRNDAGEVVAVVALRIRPEKDFTHILNVARFGA